MSREGAGIQLVAAASRTGKNLEDFIGEFPQAKGYQDYRAMLEEVRPDFVSICAFPPDREEMVSAALSAGAKAIWIEKPFAISLGEAHRMMRAAEGHEARLFVNFQRRFGRPFEWIKDAVGAGRIGDLVGVQISQPGNEFMNFGPHLVDAALNIIDAPKNRRAVKVFAAVEWSENTYQGIAAESQIVGTVHFSDGFRMVVEAGKSHPALPCVIRFDGTLGFAELRLSPLGGESGIARGHFLGDAGVTVLDTDENFHHGSVDRNLYVDRALQDILDALENGRPSRIDAAAVLPGLEIMLALYESANQGKMIDLPLARQESPF